jgi:hypothetical protein
LARGCPAERSRFDAGGWGSEGEYGLSLMGVVLGGKVLLAQLSFFGGMSFWPGWRSAADTFGLSAVLFSKLCLPFIIISKIPTWASVQLEFFIYGV